MAKIRSKSKTAKASRGRAMQAKTRNTAKEGKETLATSSDENEKEVNVDFEFFNMSEIDFHAVKQFLTVLFGSTGHSLNLSELASLITEQCADHVGTTAKSEGEHSDPLAFSTLIPIGLLRTSSLLEELVELLNSRICEKDLGTLRPYIAGPSALIVHERFINLPAGMAVPMLEGLIADWKHAQKEDSHFIVKHVLFLTPTYKLVKSCLDGEEDNVCSSTDEDNIEHFYYQEAEYLQEFSLCSFTFQTSTSHSTTDSRRTFSEKGIDASRRLFVLEGRKFESFVKLISEKLVD